MANEERARGQFDEQPLEIAINPEKPIVHKQELAHGVLKVRRGEQKKPEEKSDVPEVSLEQARKVLEQIKEKGREQGGTSQGSPGAGARSGGYNYNK
jgi:hypothetical protein